MCREIVKNVLSGTKAGFKATRNLVFNQKAERSTMNRQKSRGILENLLSGMKAGFKSILNSQHPFERKKMDTQKSSSKLSATLLALILGASVFMAGQVWAAKYVTDPSTGKLVTAPEYGGTLTFVSTGLGEGDPIDPYFRGSAPYKIGVVNETLGTANWAIDRDVFNFRTTFIPDSLITGLLAESWEQPDLQTIIFHIRKGVHWHNKAPMNGRELTAYDVEFSFQRILGLGSGFTEPGIDIQLGYFNVESVTASDDWTVVFKLKSPTISSLKEISIGGNTPIVAREVVEQYGDVTDWKNVVGTGPFELTDWVEGSSITYVKNPNYWRYDPKYPENRLPYLDEIRILVSKDRATHLALIRSGKADYLGRAGNTQLIKVDAAVSLQRTNPEVNVWPFSFRAETAFTFNTQIEPWSDIRVRRALQMAIDWETINATYFNGWADTTRTGRIGLGLVDHLTPFEEWSEELKQYYKYDPETAEALLDEAGYPRGADGVRFQTTYEHYEFFDLDYFQIAVEYFRAIGIGVEMSLNDRTTHNARIQGHQMKGLITDSTNVDYGAFPAISSPTKGHLWNTPNVNDPVYDAMVRAVDAATTLEEQIRLVKEADMYIIENHWWIAGPRTPSFNVTQPWVIGYNGEAELGGSNAYPILVLPYLWIDHDLKKEMGF